MLRGRLFDATFTAALNGGSSVGMQGFADLNTLRQYFSGGGITAFLDVPWAPVYILVSFMVSPWLGLLALVGAMLLLILTSLTEAVSQRPTGLAAKESALAQAFAQKNLQNAEVIAAHGMIQRLRQRWEKRYHAGLAWQHQGGRRVALISAGTRFCRTSLQSLSLGLGAWLVIDNQISGGAMIAASVLMGRALAPVEQVIGNWRQFLTARTAWQRLGTMLNTIPAEKPVMNLPRPKGQIRIEEVSVVPPGSKIPALKQLSFAAAPGDCVVVVGASGAGKSSLARLLAGVWLPVSGAMRLDGADSRNWPREVFGDAIGYLPQDIELFAGSVAENIARFTEADPEAVIVAARSAGLHELILRLPQGYDTPVGDGGGFLSGGMRQRIGLARALYGEPALLVLDEPNSNLDDAGEAALLQALQQARARGATIVVVTHRRNLIGVANKMLVLNDGQLQLYGPTEQVLARLAAAQNPQAAGAANPAALPQGGKG
jgi:PrtD family type I secretion system ABC transporter